MAAFRWSWDGRYIPSVDDGQEGNGRFGGVGIGKDERSGGECGGDDDGARGEGGRDW